MAHVSADDKSEPPDVCIIELGGTVRQHSCFPSYSSRLEILKVCLSLKQLDNFNFVLGKIIFVQVSHLSGILILVHVSLVPTIGGSHEQKTKPTQQVKNISTCFKFRRAFVN